MKTYFVECIVPDQETCFIVDYPISINRQGYIVKELSDEEFLAVVDIGKSLQSSREVKVDNRELLTLSRQAFADIAVVKDPIKLEPIEGIKR